MESKIKENKLMIDYINNLITEYHQQLRKQLSKQGITI